MRNKNKTLIAGIMAMLLLVSIAGAMAEEANTDTAKTKMVIAADTESTSVDSATAAEINDDLSGSASAVDMGMLRIKSWLTFNQEKKAELELKLARLELVRAKIAAKNNNTAAMEKALLAHNRIIEKVQARIEKIDNGATESGIKQVAVKVIGLERAIQVHEARIAKLNEIISSGNLSEEQMEKFQAKINQAETVIEKLKENQLAKKEKLETKLMAVSGMNKKQAGEEIQKLENEQNMAAVKKMVAEVKAQRNENAAAKISEVIAKLQAKEAESGKDMSNAIAKLTTVQQALQQKAGTIREKVSEANSNLTTE